MRRASSRAERRTRARARQAAATCLRARGLDRLALALLLAFAFLLARPERAHAQTEERSLSAGIEMHGFVSQGFILTTKNEYLARRSTRGSFEFSEVGFNFTKQFDHDLRIGIQLFARDLGPLGNYDVNADWFHLDYRFADWLGLRFGRVKLAVGLYNEVQDVDAARVFVLLPPSIYWATFRDTLLGLTGAEVYGRYALGTGGGALEYRAYGGTLHVNLPVAAQANVRYVVGGRVFWETPIDGLRLGGTVLGLKVETLAPAGMAATPGALSQYVGLMGMGSIEFVYDDWLFAAEYRRVDELRRFGELEDERTREDFYVMASLRATPWLQPGSYYSVAFRDVEQRSGRENYQHDLAGTLRFDLTLNWLFKLEAHYLIGTFDLDPGLNGGRSPESLTRRWLAFFAKTTAYF